MFQKLPMEVSLDILQRNHPEDKSTKNSWANAHNKKKGKRTSTLSIYAEIAERHLYYTKVLLPPALILLVIFYPFSAYVALA